MADRSPAKRRYQVRQTSCTGRAVAAIATFGRSGGLGAEQYGHVVIAAHLDGVALDTINAECVAPKRNMGGRASNALSAAQAASDRALVEVAERVSSAGQPVVSLRVRGPRALKLTRRVEGFVRADEIVVFDGTEQHHRSATLTVTATVAVTELKRAESPATTAGDVAIPLTVPGVAGGPPGGPSQAGRGAPAGERTSKPTWMEPRWTPPDASSPPPNGATPTISPRLASRASCETRPPAAKPLRSTSQPRLTSVIEAVEAH